HLARPLDASGFLVPRSAGLLTTACSWSSSKWQHYARAGLAVLRVSAGRTDDRRWMDLDPDDLVSTLAGELAETGVVVRDAVTSGCLEARLRPWRRSLPQYRPGHLDRVARVEACLAGETPGLAAAGAALRGVGLPACIRSGQQAAAAMARLLL
ncbi:MAG: protoporphyrinogen oxidase, partial [Acidimicrobiaceae bacterium]|nr:protoporphyrinogen oxidase [Acidimicrobiaceae bacterium]